MKFRGVLAIIGAVALFATSCDPAATIESKLYKHNLRFSLIKNDNDWIAEIFENEISIMKISSSLWLRLHAEFISLEWFINEMIIRNIKSIPLDIPQ